MLVELNCVEPKISKSDFFTLTLASHENLLIVLQDNEQ